jgi:SAM-dependent methyltransferase
MSIHNKAKIIMESYYDKQFSEKLLKCSTEFEEIQLLSTLIGMIGYKDKNFKIESYYDLLKSISDKVLLLEPKLIIPSDINLINNVIYNLLIKLTILSKGQTILCKFKNLITTYKIDSTELLISSAMNGTFLTFLFWLNISKVNKINELSTSLLEELFVESIANSDDRLYKYILDRCISNNKLFLQMKDNIIKQVIDSLANSNVPPKYILKRIKLLSQYVILHPHFNYMIATFHSPKVILTLHKYYYDTPYDFMNMFSLLKRCDLQNSSFTDMNRLYSLLKTEDEKLIYTMCTSLLDSAMPQINTINIYKITKIIVQNYMTILHSINWSHFIETTKTNKLNKLIVDIMISHNNITAYVNMNKYFSHVNNMGLYTRFLEVTDQDIKSNYNTRNIININYITHRLRLIAKKKKKTTIVQNQSRMFKLLNDIKTFEPNNNISVLKRGSYSYQLNKQKFTDVPPRHLLPGESQLYNKFILREKADGILITNLPTDIFPQSDLFNKYRIKAEYIEELDLYLIFDIDIPDTSIEERYNILRSAHPYATVSMLEMKSYNTTQPNFLEQFHKERYILKGFLNDHTKHLIKWYPKFACISNNNVMKELINNILVTNNTINLCNTFPYNCDGVVITPMDGSREIKIKPKHLMTIDLVFNNNCWYDRDNYDWSHLIKIDKVLGKLRNGSIYRCYPKDINSMMYFVPKDVRFDKKKPNPYNVVDNIICMIKNDWSKEGELITLSSENYYESTEYCNLNMQLVNQLKVQTELLESNIINMNPSYNSRWLDLGCGSGKLINIIRKYSPKYYLGLDIDIKQLVRALKYHDNVYHFNPTNLSAKWESNIKWYTMKSDTFDYVVANFSIMHFMTNDFWQELSKYVKSGTKLLFNIVNKNVSWQYNDSYLKSDNVQTKYKFEWVHMTEKTEPVIEEEYVLTHLERYNWFVLNKLVVDKPNQLAGQYSWWLVQYK